MKITTHTRPQGSALLLALLTGFVICIALTTYLYLVSNQNRSVMRSMAWNSSIPVVEAGVEEALTQLNYTAVVNMAANGWSPLSADGFYHKINDLGNGFAYDVGVKPPLATGPDQPTIESIGYAPAPANIASYYSSPWGMILGGLVPQFSPERASAKRKVRVLAKRQTPVQYAMLAGASAGPHASGPEPRLTSAQSYDPWYAPSNFAIFGRPVNPRAALIAIITASLPEFVKRT